MLDTNIIEQDLELLIYGKNQVEVMKILDSVNEKAFRDNNEEGYTFPSQPAKIISVTSDGLVVYRAEGSYPLYYISTPALVREAVSRRIKENQRQLGLRQGILIALPNEHDRKAISRLEIKLEHDKGLLERLGI